jgi:hypothetical protein
MLPSVVVLVWHNSSMAARTVHSGPCTHPSCGVVRLSQLLLLLQPLALSMLCCAVSHFCAGTTLTAWCSTQLVWSAVHST